VCLTPSPSAASREKASHGELAESRGDQETLPGFHLESRREPSAPEQRPDRGTRDVRRARAEPFSAFLVPPLPRGVSKRRLSREKRRFSRAAIRSIFLKGEKAPVQTTAGWFTVGRPTRRFQTFFFFSSRVCSFSSLENASGSRTGTTLTVYHKTRIRRTSLPRPRRSPAVLARRRHVVQSRGCVFKPKSAHGEGSVRDG
jgi:hypothetical protein